MELKNLHISGIATSYYQKKLIEEIENIIDEEVEMKHNQIAKKMENLLEKPEEKDKIKNKFGIDPLSLEFVFTPIIQSGGTYDLKPSPSIIS